MSEKSKERKKAEEENEEISEVTAETIEDDETVEKEPTEDTPDSAVESESEDEVASLEEEVESLKAEIADLKDKYVRNQADTENYRKRLLKDKEDAVRYANVALVKDLLTPLDDFSRAIAAATDKEHFDALIEGVKMTEDRIFSTLKTNWGLEAIDGKNVPFDPNLHEACLMEEVDGLKEDTVTMVLQKGYKINGRVIRPAKVKVGKAK